MLKKVLIVVLVVSGHVFALFFSAAENQQLDLTKSQTLKKVKILTGIWNDSVDKTNADENTLFFKKVMDKLEELAAWNLHGPLTNFSDKGSSDKRPDELHNGRDFGALFGADVKKLKVACFALALTNQLNDPADHYAHCKFAKLAMLQLLLKQKIYRSIYPDTEALSAKLRSLQRLEDSQSSGNNDIGSTSSIPKNWRPKRLNIGPIKKLSNDNLKAFFNPLPLAITFFTKDKSVSQSLNPFLRNYINNYLTDVDEKIKVDEPQSYLSVNGFFDLIHKQPDVFWLSLASFIGSEVEPQSETAVDIKPLFAAEVDQNALKEFLDIKVEYDGVALNFSFDELLGEAFLENNENYNHPKLIALPKVQREGVGVASLDTVVFSQIQTLINSQALVQDVAKNVSFVGQTSTHSIRPEGAKDLSFWQRLRKLLPNFRSQNVTATVNKELGIPLLLDTKNEKTTEGVDFITKRFAAREGFLRFWNKCNLIRKFWIKEFEHADKKLFTFSQKDLVLRELRVIADLKRLLFCFAQDQTLRVDDMSIQEASLSNAVRRLETRMLLQQVKDNSYSRQLGFQSLESVDDVKVNRPLKVSVEYGMLLKLKLHRLGFTSQDISELLENMEVKLRQIIKTYVCEDVFKSLKIVLDDSKKVAELLVQKDGALVIKLPCEGHEFPLLKTQFTDYKYTDILVLAFRENNTVMYNVIMPVITACLSQHFYETQAESFRLGDWKEWNDKSFVEYVAENGIDANIPQIHLFAEKELLKELLRPIKELPLLNLEPWRDDDSYKQRLNTVHTELQKMQKIMKSSIGQRFVQLFLDGWNENLNDFAFYRKYDVSKHLIVWIDTNLIWMKEIYSGNKPRHRDYSEKTQKQRIDFYEDLYFLYTGKNHVISNDKQNTILETSFSNINPVFVSMFVAKGGLEKIVDSFYNKFNTEDKIKSLQVPYIEKLTKQLCPFNENQDNDLIKKYTNIFKEFLNGGYVTGVGIEALCDQAYLYTTLMYFLDNAALDFKMYKELSDTLRYGDDSSIFKVNLGRNSYRPNTFGRLFDVDIFFHLIVSLRLYQGYPTESMSPDKLELDEQVCNDLAMSAYEGRRKLVASNERVRNALLKKIMRQQPVNRDVTFQIIQDTYNPQLSEEAVKKMRKDIEELYYFYAVQKLLIKRYEEIKDSNTNLTIGRFELRVEELNAVRAFYKKKDSLKNLDPDQYFSIVMPFKAIVWDIYSDENSGLKRPMVE